MRLFTRSLALGILLVAAATPLLSAQGGPDTSMATDPPGRVLGTVSAGGEPVAFAQVGVKGYPMRATADDHGRFLVRGLDAGTYTLLVSALGYGTTQVEVVVEMGELTRADVLLEREALGLNPLVVTATRKQTFVSESSVKVDVVPGSYLRTMAASSLMESIQHVNGLYQQVDCAVCYTNNIRINGMEGPYTAVLIDGQPIMSSLASVYGLNGINASLIERVEIIKGPSSTLYGSDAMAGVINVITKDPRFAPRLAMDAQRTSHGATNLEFAAAPSLGGVRGLVSGSVYRQGTFVDDNGDGYSDIPLDTRLSLFGKVHVPAARGGGLSLSGKYYHEDRFGGERAWTRALRGSDTVYGESIYTNRFELLGRWGLPVAVEGLTLDFSLTNHRQDAMYGDSPYEADQQVVAANLVWDAQLGQRHDFLLGVGGDYQAFDDGSPATAEPVRHFTPGVFVQNEYSATRAVKLLGGLRLDHHRDHGAIVSPRAAVKVEPFHNNAIRLNAGTGFRVVDLFTEDYAALMHTRRLVTATGLEPERSYNVTLNVNQIVEWGNNPMMIDVDAFYTHFTNRIIPDYDTDPAQIIYHNLDGFGVTRGVGLSLNQNLTVMPLYYTLGITFQDVFYEHAGVREDELFAAAFKAVWSATYTLARPGIALDYTGTVVGPMRLPAYDAPFERATRSETYAVHNAMATWRGKNGVEVYAGVRNLLDYAQPSPITDPANPFGDSFDTAWVYGPLVGRSFVVGARYGLGR
jgi:outer membrane receptor for ferrienterochelin and colicins